MIITCIRDYKVDATMGDLFIDGDLLGYTCEDLPRPFGVKFFGKTCIPEGVYKISISMSNRFGRDMPIIYTEDDHRLVKGGISFTGIRIHGGNTVHDTEGCPILGARTNSVDRVSECRAINEVLVDRIKDAIGQGDSVKYVVTSI